LEAILGQIVHETLAEKYPIQQSTGGDIKHEALSSSSSQYCTKKKKERKKERNTFLGEWRMKKNDGGGESN
jgi:hypothetical protein